jgi:hypothetical protein
MTDNRQVNKYQLQYSERKRYVQSIGEPSIDEILIIAVRITKLNSQCANCYR